MKKRFLTVILMTVLCFTGCGASDKTNDDIGQLQEEMEAIQSEIEQLQSEKSELQAELSQQTTTVTTVPVTTVTTTETSKVIDAPANDWDIEYLYGYYENISDPFKVSGRAEGTYFFTYDVNGELKVEFEMICGMNNNIGFYTVDRIYVHLWRDEEYVRMNDVFYLFVTDESGNTIEFEISGYDGSAWYMDDVGKNNLLNAMANNDVLYFTAFAENTAYEFTMNCIGFEDVSSEWFY